MLSCINEDNIYYGGIKCLINGNIKFYHLFLVGENVNGMKKGKASMYKNSVFSLFEAHGEISCPSITELSKDVIHLQIVQLSKANTNDILF